MYVNLQNLFVCVFRKYTRIFINLKYKLVSTKLLLAL